MIKFIVINKISIFFTNLKHISIGKRLIFHFSEKKVILKYKLCLNSLFKKLSDYFSLLNPVLKLTHLTPQTMPFIGVAGIFFGGTRFEDFQKDFLRKFRKMHYFSIFSKKFNNP